MGVCDLLFVYSFCCIKNHMWCGNIDAKMHLKHFLSGKDQYTLNCINLHQSSSSQSAKTVYWTLLTICMCKYILVLSLRFNHMYTHYTYTFLSLFSPCILFFLSLSSLFFLFSSFCVPSNWRVYFSQWFPQSEPLHACVYVLSALKNVTSLISFVWPFLDVLVSIESMRTQHLTDSLQRVCFTKTLLCFSMCIIVYKHTRSHSKRSFWLTWKNKTINDIFLFYIDWNIFNPIIKLGQIFVERSLRASFLLKLWNHVW